MLYKVHFGYYFCKDISENKISHTYRGEIVIESDELDSEEFKERVVDFLDLEYHGVVKENKITNKTVDFLWFDINN